MILDLLVVSSNDMMEIHSIGILVNHIVIVNHTAISRIMHIPW